MFRNILIPLLFFLITLYPASAVRSETSAAIFFSPLQYRGVMGQDVTVRIWLKPAGQSISEVVASLSYPQDFLQFQAAEVNPVFSSSSTTSTISVRDAGRLTVHVTSDSVIDRDTEVALIHFTVKQKGWVTFSFERDTHVFRDGQFIPLEKMNARWEIRAAKPQSVAASLPDTDSASRPPDSAYVQNTIASDSLFTAPIPLLRGVSSVPGAKIHIAVDQGLVSGDTRADGAGSWEWAMPPGLLPGVYWGIVSAIHPQYASVTDKDTVRLEVIRADVSATQYEVKLEPQPLRLRANSSLELTTHFIHLGSTPENQLQTPAHAAYTIEDPHGSSVYEAEEDVLMVGSETIRRNTVRLPDGSLAGEYTARVALSIGGATVMNASTSFRVLSWWQPFIIPILAGCLVIVMTIMTGKKLRERQRNRRLKSK